MIIFFKLSLLLHPFDSCFTHLLFVIGNNNFYSYFAKAGWMSSSHNNYHRSRENYELLSEGKILVKKAGLYIVHASVSIYIYKSNLVIL